jgi:ATP-dependent helicase/nuclease subunit B
MLAHACSDILAASRGELPAAANFVVVLPSLHAVASVAREIVSRARGRALMLPRFFTLRSLAATVATDRNVVAPAAREARLYRALASRDWFSGADLWALASELSSLFDELTRWRTVLPDLPEAFATRLHQAYGADARASFSFEARLIHSLWQADRSGEDMDPETAYAAALAKYARAVDVPLFAIGLGRLASIEDEFLCCCAQRVAVTIYDDDARLARSGVGRVLAAAWPRPLRFDIASRALEVRAVEASSPLSERLRMFGAVSAEEEAAAIATAVRNWLDTGYREIGVVVFDRLVARRARALLERVDVLVSDIAGWAMSTTSAATVISRWLDIVSNDFYYRDFLDLLKSPFIFHDRARDERQDAVWRLERLLRRANAHSSLETYIKLAASDGVLAGLLSQVARAEQHFARRRRKSLKEWLDALAQALTELGVRKGLAADAAGAELLDLLDRLAADLATDATRVDFGEWRRWFARKLEQATFRDRSIDSPVIFTTLDATRLRRFDAVLICGADAVNLPGQANDQVFFNQAVRRELGLPDRAVRMQAIEFDLRALIENCRQTLVTWQRIRDGEVNLVSPYFERLSTLHGLAWDDWLEAAPDLRAAIAKTRDPAASAGLPVPRGRPAPSVPQSRLPSAISASAYNRLVACPYQFHAHHVLGLADADEMREEIDKSDYGIRVHSVLAEFHRTYPSISSLTPGEAHTALMDISTRAFRDLLQLDFEATAWLERWIGLVPDYLRWQREREAEGWRFIAAEEDRTLNVTTPAGRLLVLKGRIDRADRAACGEIAVLDYKTRSADRLRNALKTPGEDVQLCAYALLWSGEIAAAAYLSIDRDGVAAVPLDADIAALAAATRDRIGRLYDAMCAGTPLPANGADEVCEYCEMSGLCRKRYWVDESATHASARA